MTKRSWPLLIAIPILLAGQPASAAGKKAKKADAATTDNYDEMFNRYLEAARKQAPTGGADPSSWMNMLMLDQRARRVNDVVTVRVIESITASGSADANLSKAGSAAVGVPNLFGLEKKLPGAIDPTNLVSAKHDTEFKGAGTTNRAGVLTAVLSARVSEVLPNGDLVLEAVRQIEINGDRQMVVLTGVARVADLGPDNVVASTSLAQLRIRYFGSGLMKDSLSPGWLVRVLNKIF